MRILIFSYAAGPVQVDNAQRSCTINPNLNQYSVLCRQIYDTTGVYNIISQLDGQTYAS